MKNEKAFTLVELLAVLVIMGIILGITIPSAIDLVQTQNQRKYQIHEKIVKQATDAYIDQFGNTFEEEQGVCSCYKINYNSLLSENLIKEDDITCQYDEGAESSSVILIYPLEDRKHDFRYEYYLNCRDKNTNELIKSSPTAPNGCCGVNGNFSILDYVVKYNDENGDPYPQEGDNWTYHNVYQRFKANDPYMAGIIGYEYSLDGGITWTFNTGDNFTFTNNMDSKVQVRAVDNDGNVSTVKSYYVRIDKTDPNPVIQGTRVSNNTSITSNTITSSNVKLTVSAKEGKSGVKYQWQKCSSTDASSCQNINDQRTKTYTVSDEGVSYYRIIATTGAGLVKESSIFIVNINKSDFTITVKGGSGGNVSVQNVTQNKNVTATPSATSTTIKAKVDDNIKVTITTNAGYKNAKLKLDDQVISSGTQVQNGAKNHTVQGSWETQSYIVTYNYAQNGGSSATEKTATVPYGSAVSLSPTATKSGYTFVGWNTNKDATSALTSYKMPASNTTLYAIFKKTITATVYSGTKNATKKTASVTVYNNSTGGNVTLPTGPAGVSGWTFLGYRMDTKATTQSYASGGVVYLSSNTTFYSTYKKTVTVTYNANGGSSTPAKQTGTAYYNSNGTYANASIKLAAAITRSRDSSGREYSFSKWGNYSAGQQVSIRDNLSLTASWTKSRQWIVDNDKIYHITGYMASRWAGTTQQCGSWGCVTKYYDSVSEQGVGNISGVDSGWKYLNFNWIGYSDQAGSAWVYFTIVNYAQLTMSTNQSNASGFRIDKVAVNGNTSFSLRVRSDASTGIYYQCNQMWMSN